MKGREHEVAFVLRSLYHELEVHCERLSIEHNHACVKLAHCLAISRRIVGGVYDVSCDLLVSILVELYVLGVLVSRGVCGLIGLVGWVAIRVVVRCGGLGRTI